MLAFLPAGTWNSKNNVFDFEALIWRTWLTKLLASFLMVSIVLDSNAGYQTVELQQGISS